MQTKNEMKITNYENSEIYMYENRNSPNNDKLLRNLQNPKRERSQIFEVSAYFYIFVNEIYSKEWKEWGK